MSAERCHTEAFWGLLTLVHASFDSLWHNLTVRLEKIVDGQDSSALEGVDPVEMFKS